ncbi:MAG: AAA family ATPase [Candidatus Omnitrophota bacterium]
MYFKKLELYGFKSFVDKTTLLFEPGVTAIVGPNGTGKSNISDAIKWVLGEQSAKSMRGAKMEDIIFNGTDSRDPVNLAEVSLTLSNEGRHLPIDYDEVTITRRLYRSGESDYLLNKTPVRLKDINELLMGTGIGTESYSLLEQGRIDSIISSRPEDRRIIFEEASGITKFKKKKNEALRRLEQTEENLLRVNDIIVEVTRQLNSIQRQVNKARKYQEHFEELKILDTQYTYREYSILKEERQKLQSEDGQCRGDQESIESELINLSESFNTLKNTLTQVESDYKDLSTKVMIADTQIEKNTDRVQLNKERIEEFTQRLNTAVLDIENTKKKIEDLRQQRAQLDARIAVFQEEKNAKEHQLNCKQAALSEIEAQAKEAKETVAQVKARAVNLLSEHAQMKNNLAKLSANIHNANARLTRLHQEKSKTEVELTEIDSSFREKIKEIENLKGRVDEEEKQEFELHSQREGLTAGIKRLEEGIQTAKQELISKQSQFIMLEDLGKNYEGFSSAVKALMTKREEFPEQFVGVDDVLVNLLEVIPGYEVCVENALADSLQAIVVESRQVMLRLRDFISEQQIGRVRIIALDAIPEESKDAAIAGVQPVSDFIRCDERYKKVICYLLKNIFYAKKILTQAENSENRMYEVIPKIDKGPAVVNSGVRFSYYSNEKVNVDVVGDFNDWRMSSDSMLELIGPGVWSIVIPLKAGRFRYKFIIDGQWLVDPNNSSKEIDNTGNANSILEVKEIISEKEQIDEDVLSKLPVAISLITQCGEIYGACEMISKSNSDRRLGLISQKAEMRRLREACRQIDITIEDLANQEGIQQEQLKRVEIDLSQLTKILHHEKVIFANKDSERANIEGARKKLDDELSVINLEIDETTLDLNELVEKETQGKKTLEEIDEENQRNEQQMSQAQEIINNKTNEREDLLVDIAEKKTEFSLVNEQEAALNQNLDMLTQNFDQQHSVLNESQRQQEESGKRIEELSAQVVQLEEQIKAMEQQKQETEVQLEQIRQQRNALLAEFENMQNLIREQEKTLNTIKNRIRDLDVKSVELNFKIDSLKSGVGQYYKIDLETLIMELPQDVDWQQQKDQIDVLKQKVDRLGSVNLAAVEEEEELKERADFLNSQKDDLMSAKETLMQAIRKINKTTKTLFMETFEKAKETFKEYFKLLFSGGDAQLYLSEDKDILESGVEIVVRPPGKRLQSITLLSGGEKTLTAIALLFAVFKIKPTPFCVLDEMDAPLDESNIDRFTRVLQEFLKDSQFIIITHNKKTIAMADVMYGVTMAEPGVSRLVSVKFSDHNKSDEPVDHPSEISATAVPY